MLALAGAATVDPDAQSGTRICRRTCQPTSTPSTPTALPADHTIPRVVRRLRYVVDGKLDMRLLDVAEGTDLARGVDGLAGFTRTALGLHTDRSLEADAPSLLATMVISPAARGGHTLLVDGAQVLTELRRYFPLLAITSHLRLRTRDGTMIPVVEMLDGFVKMRFRDDKVAAPVGATGERAILDALRALVSTAAKLRQDAGCGYILHNHRYLHGRSSFAGGRLLVRMLARVSDGHALSWLNKGFRVESP